MASHDVTASQKMLERPPATEGGMNMPKLRTLAPLVRTLDTRTIKPPPPPPTPTVKVQEG